MKALCINGSPRANGNTAFVLGKVCAGLADGGAEVTAFTLGELDIRYCRGCKTCAKTSACVIRDDMDRLHAELRVADIVVIASPSYWGDVTGQLKVFIERCTPLLHGDFPAGKRGLAVAIRAGQRREENQHLIDTIHHYFGHLAIEPAGAFTMEGIDSAEGFAGREAELQQAYELGRVATVGHKAE